MRKTAHSSVFRWTRPRFSPSRPVTGRIKSNQTLSASALVRSGRRTRNFRRNASTGRPASPPDHSAKLSQAICAHSLAAGRTRPIRMCGDRKHIGSSVPGPSFPARTACIAPARPRRGRHLVRLTRASLAASLRSRQHQPIRPNRLAPGARRETTIPAVQRRLEPFARSRRSLQNARSPQDGVGH